ncbi:MAG: hypothetical protein HN833_05250 [Elusimicrobiaceae bacterium]|jgi:dihydrofolate synthase / folylpolyglutamate synthase|nr:hypothetical protein [Elusimicrobiaceae bacterium]MBT3955218.1 hypothetical protein [Elusimicrobiaceae bacterium]MBT4007787.1 hypothetical protein [Elusimicrobiaceae bacterium]MBT4403316.1 hypothetical protein [Elusimicrobiaceae bacterium]MBT4440378.1 hypothetical protein [Elusimicrobiaceae bacterium]
MKTTAIKTTLFKPKQDLFEFIIKSIPKLKDKSVLAISSKIVALAENRIVENKNKTKLIKQESDFAINTKVAWLTIKDNMIIPFAGIDESNADGKLILLPKNPYKTASELRKKLKKHYKIKNLGVIITDSFIVPLRRGVMAFAVGYAGFKGVRNYIGKKDLYGRKMKMEQLNIADILASTSALNMGEANEKKPLAIIENAPIVFCEKVNKKEISYPIKDDLYYPFLKPILKNKH